MSATKIGVLKHGLKIGETVHKSFEIREALAQDFFDAEADVTQDQPMTYRSALLAKQLVSIGEYTGPFTLALLGKLKGRDLAKMLAKQKELDAEGEDEQPA